MKYTPQNDNCLETALAALKRDTQSANRKLVVRCSLGSLSLLFAILPLAPLASRFNAASADSSVSSFWSMRLIF